MAYRGNGLQFPEHLRWDSSHMLHTFGSLGFACSRNEKRRPLALNQQDSSSTWPTNIAWDGSIPPALMPRESQETLWSINIDHNRTQGRTGEMRERENQRKRIKGGWGLLSFLLTAESVSLYLCNQHMAPNYSLLLHSKEPLKSFVLKPNSLNGRNLSE